MSFAASSSQCPSINTEEDRRLASELCSLKRQSSASASWGDEEDDEDDAMDATCRVSEPTSMSNYGTSSTSTASSSSSLIFIHLYDCAAAVFSFLLAGWLCHAVFLLGTAVALPLHWMAEQTLVRQLGWLKPPTTAAPHSWPPPALILLALITGITLIVHPDGFTWILLPRLR
jgi:hypothetical protein